MNIENKKAEEVINNIISLGHDIVKMGLTKSTKTIQIPTEDFITLVAYLEKDKKDHISAFEKNIQGLRKRLEELEQDAYLIGQTAE